MKNLLKTASLGRSFGGLRALHDINVDVKDGQIIGIIGPNGAGKSTFFNVVSGVYKPSNGSVFFDGENIAGLPRARIARLGIGRTFQQTTVFSGLSVREALVRSRILRDIHSPFAWIRDIMRKDIDTHDDRVDRVLEMINLQNVSDVETSSLPYGQQKILGIGMVLIQDPKLIMMDEPAAGLNSSEKVAMTNLIQVVNTELRKSIVLVEHDMRMVMSLCEDITVIDHGRQIASGTPREIRENPQVINAYMGTADESA